MCCCCCCFAFVLRILLFYLFHTYYNINDIWFLSEMKIFSRNVKMVLLLKKRRWRRWQRQWQYTNSRTRNRQPTRYVNGDAMHGVDRYSQSSVHEVQSTMETVMRVRMGNCLCVRLVEVYGNGNSFEFERTTTTTTDVGDNCEWRRQSAVAAVRSHATRLNSTRKWIEWNPARTIPTFKTI